MYLILLGFFIVVLIIIFVILVKIIIYNYFNICNFNIYELFTNSMEYDPTTFDNYVTNTPIATMDPLYVDYMLVNSHLFIPKSNEIIKPNPTISPVLYIATQSSLLTQLKDKNDEIKCENTAIEKKVGELQLKLTDLTSELRQKEEEKLRLSGEVADMDKLQFINNKIISLIVKGMNANIDKEQQLSKYEKDLDTKKEKLETLLLTPTPTLPPVEIKEQQLKIITDKLAEIEKTFTELNKKVPENPCSKPMPEPSAEAFIFNVEEVQTPTHSWCMCNDDNKNSPDCIDYMSCQINYLKNKNSTSLIGDDLTLYTKCINRFSNFPKYLNI